MDRQPMNLDFSVGDMILSELKGSGQYYEKNLVEENLPPDLIGSITADFASRFNVVPVGVNGDRLVLVAEDSGNALQNQSLLEEFLGRPVELLLTSEDNIRYALEKYYDISIYAQSRRGAGRANTGDIDNSPLQRKADEILAQGMEEDASDIHIKPFSKGIYVWMRVNGDLRDMTHNFDFIAEDGDMLANVIKGKDESSNADSANKLMPNNGSFRIQHGATTVRCRLSTVPVGSASDLVQKLDVRLMPQVNKRVSLDKLFFGKDLETIQNVLFKSSSGMFLNVGPVGTGKTTSLYAYIDYLWNLAQSRSSVLHVYTIENPIEIADERYTQVQVRETDDEATNLTALKILDSALRSDPDVILFGEIRNNVEAEAAMRASQTGLKMLSTLHAGNCNKAILRLLNLGVNPFAILSELRFILCQRLVPILCPDCSQPHVLTAQEKAILTKEEIEYLAPEGGVNTLRERSHPSTWGHCTNPHCRSGVLQRLAVPEYIVFDDVIRDALLHQNDFHSVRELLKSYGFKSMWEKGLVLVKDGQAEIADVINRIGKD